jgi:hypothetical protein
MRRIVIVKWEEYEVIVVSFKISFLYVVKRTKRNDEITQNSLHLARKPKSEASNYTAGVLTPQSRHSVVHGLSWKVNRIITLDGEL